MQTDRPGSSSEEFSVRLSWPKAGAAPADAPATPEDAAPPAPAPSAQPSPPTTPAAAPRPRPCSAPCHALDAGRADHRFDLGGRDPRARRRPAPTAAAWAACSSRRSTAWPTASSSGSARCARTSTRTSPRCGPSWPPSARRSRTSATACSCASCGPRSTSCAATSWACAGRCSSGPSSSRSRATSPPCAATCRSCSTPAPTARRRPRPASCSSELQQVVATLSDEVTRLSTDQPQVGALAPLLEEVATVRERAHAGPAPDGAAGHAHRRRAARADRRTPSPTGWSRTSGPTRPSVKTTVGGVDPSPSSSAAVVGGPPAPPVRARSASARSCC